MVGVGTILADDPQLTVRLPGLKPARRFASYSTAGCGRRRLRRSSGRRGMVPTWIVATRDGAGRAGAPPGGRGREGFARVEGDATRPRRAWSRRFGTWPTRGITRVFTRAVRLSATRSPRPVSSTRSLLATGRFRARSAGHAGARAAARDARSKKLPAHRERNGRSRPVRLLRKASLMFTGLRYRHRRSRGRRRPSRAALRRLRIHCAYDAATITLGASIACAGPCLTVVAVGPRAEAAAWFEVDAAAETLARTTVGAWTGARGSTWNAR